MMKSIRNRILRNFLIVIISTIFILDISTIICLKAYYYKNTAKTLENGIDSSINFYNRYFSSKELIENVYDNIDAFWDNSKNQVEILDENGQLLMDSFGIRDEKILNTPDIAKAIKGETGVWTGSRGNNNEKIMIVSKAISSKLESQKIIGILRLIYPLNEVLKTIKYFTIFFLSISIGVIIIGIVMSLIIAKDIIKPIKKVTCIAKEMAEGNLNIRSDINDNIEISQLSSTLNYMASEVLNRERVKNEFISSVSHELRTPLTAIKGWAITLSYDYDDVETIKLGLDIIERESDRLTEMVEELLDFSKIINGVTSLICKEHDVKNFIEYIENYMKPRATREGKNFEVYIQDNIGTWIFDEKRIKQVLINIIDNAFKFTEQSNTIKLNVVIENDKLKFSVSDNGIGISHDDLPRVKEKFYKGKDSKSKNGIGLSISDEIIKLHGGQINIESELNIGTTVIVEIPLYRNEE
ncbi:sensor histidine kinase [Clostridium celatum]|uniref:histidine kinase n=1 Tax=Clostridium celatum DSM 1785 TaxID=545697 RepID=L1QL40_9CLOT|nr:HAMP domain-containing sensor histidine kinase [Clostridium celatum]EKY28693.1 ATPase/histidine kinase/DNA gyrase B/HSP90 domain protein [Clostridium celatum DSM 1785]MCE9655334.1 HAMP domain-containing histidine kinase [Clostridium celatum]MDU3721841.1 HAMP domain-containing sensor histidine kinase [Clostridium celatum]